jgi:hypothetical protein
MVKRSSAAAREPDIMPSANTVVVILFIVAFIVLLPAAFI